MTFTFNRVSLAGIMELTGEIDFLPGKIAIIYGSNQQGKTNVINAIRYAFLRDVFARAGRTKIQYDERRLPSREEMIFGNHADIEVSFEYDKTAYTLRRSIQSNGKREVSTLYKTSDPDNTLDVAPYLRGRLKVSLLDALFAPEIAQGFKQLYSGDIDEAVAQMFKEITTLRVLANGFMVRLDRLKSAADVGRANIEASYNDFANSVLKTAPTLSTLRSYKNLKTFEAGKISDKLGSLYEETQKVVGKLKEGGLVGEIEEASAKAKHLSKISRRLGEQGSMKEKVAELRDVRHDLTALTVWVRSASSIKSVEGRPKQVPKFKTEGVRSKLAEVLSTFDAAKKKRGEAEELATHEKVRIEDAAELLANISKVIRLLSAKTKIGKEVATTVTKVGGKVYTIIPVKLLERDPAFGEINRQPIPRGSHEDHQRHVKLLKQRQHILRIIKRRQGESETLFDSFADIGIQTLNHLVDTLGNREEEIEKVIGNWSDDLSSDASSFTNKKVKARPMASPKAIDGYARSIRKAVDTAALRHLAKVNETLKDLSIRVDELKQSELSTARTKVATQMKDLEHLETVASEVSEKRNEWKNADEEYADFLQVPRIADKAERTLTEILSRCFDESMLRERIVGTYNEIIRLMQERRLVQATAEINPGELKSVVRYKGKTISHPAGSEKSFFSLAILTALAHYFQTPVLIDEVANNLDTKNLKAFFELVSEFKDRYSIQFVLSIKQTNDFDLDGWVKDMSEEISVHEIKDKIIQRITV